MAQQHEISGANALNTKVGALGAGSIAGLGGSGVSRPILAKFTVDVNPATGDGFKMYAEGPNKPPRSIQARLKITEVLRCFEQGQDGKDQTGATPNVFLDLPAGQGATERQTAEQNKASAEERLRRWFGSCGVSAEMLATKGLGELTASQILFRSKNGTVEGPRSGLVYIAPGDGGDVKDVVRFILPTEVDGITKGELKLPVPRARAKRNGDKTKAAEDAINAAMGGDASWDDAPANGAGKPATGGSGAVVEELTF